MSLTGNRETDFIYLQKLEDSDLLNACDVNQYTRELCRDERFWMNRIIKKQSLESFKIMKEKNPNVSNHDLYFQIFYPASVCSNIIKNARSQLVIEDLYGPDGFVGTASVVLEPLLNFKKYIILKTAYTLLEKQPGKEKEKKSLMTNIKKLEKKMSDSWKNIISRDSYILTNTDIRSFHVKVLEDKGGKIGEKISPKSIKNHIHFDNIIEKIKMTDKEYEFIYNIHLAFKNFQIPLTITWSEICTHPLFLRQLIKV